MIFDNINITALVMEWQDTQDRDVLARIIAGCKGLIEAIVSSYDYIYRDDLIQEATLKVIKSISVFDPDVATLHNYLTTVIKNSCLSWLSKYDNQRCVTVEDIDDFIPPIPERDNSGDLLVDVITRNRERFASLPVDVIDDITTMIITRLRGGMVRTKVVTYIAEVTGYDRSLVASIYASTLVYIRTLHPNYRRNTLSNSNLEFTLIPEMIEIIGESNFKKLQSAFSGFTVHIP